MTAHVCCHLLPSPLLSFPTHLFFYGHFLNPLPLRPIFCLICFSTLLCCQIFFSSSFPLFHNPGCHNHHLVTICSELVPIITYESWSPSSGAHSQIFIQESTRHNEWACGRANEKQCSFYWGIHLNGPLGSWEFSHPSAGTGLVQGGGRVITLLIPCNYSGLQAVPTFSLIVDIYSVCIPSLSSRFLPHPACGWYSQLAIISQDVFRFRARTLLSSGVITHAATLFCSPLLK